MQVRWQVARCQARRASQATGIPVIVNRSMLAFHPAAWDLYFVYEQDFIREVRCTLRLCDECGGIAVNTAPGAAPAW